MTDLAAFTAALAAADRQPETSYDALAALAEATVGGTLITLLTFDETAGLARRCYSNQPEAYPVAGTKPVPESHWAEAVLRGGKTFVANDIAAITEVFPDHALIRSLGCEACINVPAVVAGQVIGTLNCLHRAGHYTPEKVAASEALKLPTAACLLLTATGEP